MMPLYLMRRPRRSHGDRTQHRQRGGLIRPSATRAAAFVAVPICFPAAQHSSTHLEGASIPTTSAAPIAATFGLSVKTRNFDCCGQYPKMIALN